MKMLLITQTVDTQDTVLGFFTKWIDECATRTEHVTVICLKQGTYDAPAHVSVHSLGKEHAFSKFSKTRYVILFFSYIWKYRDQYDTVFVHMNQEYVLLGAVVWKLLGKKIVLWRNHAYGNDVTRIAVRLSDIVFCTSTHSFTASFAKTHIMPAGIDTTLLRQNITSVVRKKNSLLMLGRIAPVKHIEKAITALVLVHAQGDAEGEKVTLTIVGDALPRDSAYLASLRAQVEKLQLTRFVSFLPGVPFAEVGKMYASHEICLNFTDSGSFDKTVFEALACGARVLVTNESMKALLPKDSFTQASVESIAPAMSRLLSLSETQKEEYSTHAEHLVAEQSLSVLWEKIIQCIYQDTEIKK